MADLSPGGWLALLEARLDARWFTQMGVCDAYYEGDHALTFATAKFREAFGSLFGALADNWMPIVVDSSVERLTVQGFRFGRTQDADQQAWDIWQANGLDAESDMLHTEAVKLGEAYWLVEPPARGSSAPPKITSEHPSQVIVAWAPGDRRRRLAALKKWKGDDGFAYCNPPEAPVWMGDLSFKAIGDVEIGDVVVGWTGTGGRRGEKRTLTQSTVTNVMRRTSPIVRVTMESGRSFRCTPDHRWLSHYMRGRSEGRAGFVDGESFVTPRVGETLVHVIDPTPPLPSGLEREAAWLGGMFDGEGSASRQSNVLISQSQSHNPEVCAEVERSLAVLDVAYKQTGDGRGFIVNSGRQNIVNFANWTQPVRRRGIVDHVLRTRWRHADQIVSVEPDGEGEVVAMTTTTGNYICNGYASKNCTLYLPDQVVKYESQQKLTATAGRRINWTRRADDPGGENPLGVVPVVPVCNAPSMIRGGQSDLRPCIPLQNAVNKLLCDMLIGSEYQAFPQRVLMGVDIPKDDNGQPISAAQLKASQSRMWTFANENAKAFEFNAADLDNYVKAIQNLVQHLTAISRTPPHYIAGQIVNASGDALKAAETGLVSKVRQKMSPFGEAHEDTMRLAFRALGDERKAAETSAETIWKDPESRSQGELVDSLTKLSTIGVPQEILWERAGFSPQEIDRMRAMQETESLLAQTAPAPPTNGQVANAGVPAVAPTH